MKARHVLAGVLVTVGILYLVGAVGNSDFYGYFTASDGMHILLGFALIIFPSIAQIVAENGEK